MSMYLITKFDSTSSKNQMTENCILSVMKFVVGDKSYLHMVVYSSLILRSFHG
jgi:hypothetical protein